MKSSFFLLSILLSLHLTTALFAADEAIMYKKTDKNGNVVFTDKEIPGSKPIKVKTDTNVISRPKPTVFQPQTGTEPDDNEDNVYQTFEIDKPNNNQAVQTVNGNVTVIANLSPRLQPKHLLQIFVDGEPVGPPQRSLYFALTKIEKGPHQLSLVAIHMDTGEEVQSSESVSFKAY